MNNEDIRLIVDGEYLQISGRRATAYQEPPVHHLQMEIPQGRFERVLRLGRSYDPERVHASLEDGILTVVLARSEPQVRKIPVDVP